VDINAENKRGNFLNEKGKHRNQVATGAQKLKAAKEGRQRAMIAVGEPSHIEISKKERGVK